jgi:hypothetical protein
LQAYGSISVFASETVLFIGELAIFEVGKLLFVVVEGFCFEVSDVNFDFLEFYFSWLFFAFLTH